MCAIRVSVVRSKTGQVNRGLAKQADTHQQVSKFNVLHSRHEVPVPDNRTTNRDSNSLQQGTHPGRSYKVQHRNGTEKDTVSKQLIKALEGVSWQLSSTTLVYLRG